MNDALSTLGIDIGSTTIKYVLLDEKLNVLASHYVRHRSAVVQTLKTLITELLTQYSCGRARLRLSGSGALLIAQKKEKDPIKADSVLFIKVLCFIQSLRLFQWRHRRKGRLRESPTDGFSRERFYRQRLLRQSLCRRPRIPNLEGWELYGLKNHCQPR